MRLLSSFALVLICVFLSVASAFYFVFELSPMDKETNTGLPLIREISTSTQEAVVAIEVRKDDTISENLFYGSGFVFEYEQKRYILTNYHVIRDAKKIYINFIDGSSSEGKVLGSDSELDLAILEFSNSDKIKPLSFSPSTRSQIGDWVLAFGNPHGIGHTVTFGIISAKEREVTMEGRTFKHLLQTDASLNPGSSGGPLVDMNGKVLGINTAVLGESQGVGFAVPSEIILENVGKLIESGYIDRPFIGINLIDTKKGILVTNVYRESPAEKSGLKVDDVITKIDKREVYSTQDLIQYIQDNKGVGDEISLTVKQKEKIKFLKMKLGNKMEILEENN